tara:strand:+ start:13 stop:411 length:399 start_codon:yes stop_codon:yes gene_type:complete
MRYYETIYIINPNLDNNNLDAILTEVGEQLTKTGSKIINHYNWGKKRLSYSIDNQKYGSYIILQYETDNKSKMNEFEMWMKLNNAIIRHMTTVLEDKPSIYIDEKEKDNLDKKEDDLIDESADKKIKKEEAN